MDCRLLLLLLLCAFLFTNCTNKKTNHAEVNTISNSKNSVDTFVRDVPSRIDKDPYRKKQKEQLEKELDLKKIENGAASIEVRVWLTYVFKDTLQLLVLKHEKLKWVGELLTIKYIQTDSTISVSKAIRQNLNPNSGWESLWEKLNQLDFIELKDFMSIPGYHIGTDGDYITVEIGTPKMYKLYSYQQPSIYVDKIPEAKKIETIMKLLEDELGFKRLREF